MMLDKKQSQAIFLFKFNMGHKTVETTLNINNACGPGTANGHTAQRWFREFRKEDENLEDEECSGRHRKLTPPTERIIKNSSHEVAKVFLNISS